MTKPSRGNGRAKGPTAKTTTLSRERHIPVYYFTEQQVMSAELLSGFNTQELPEQLMAVHEELYNAEEDPGLMARQGFQFIATLAAVLLKFSTSTKTYQAKPM